MRKETGEQAVALLMLLVVVTYLATYLGAS